MTRSEAGSRGEKGSRRSTPAAGTVIDRRNIERRRDQRRAERRLPVQPVEKSERRDKERRGRS